MEEIFWAKICLFQTNFQKYQTEPYPSKPSSEFFYHILASLPLKKKTFSPFQKRLVQWKFKRQKYSVQKMNGVFQKFIKIRIRLTICKHLLFELTAPTRKLATCVGKCIMYVLHIKCDLIAQHLSDRCQELTGFLGLICVFPFSVSASQVVHRGTEWFH